jgi:hypothetical protein
MSAAVATIGQSARVRRKLTSHAPKKERISGQLQVRRRSRNTTGRPGRASLPRLPFSFVRKPTP